MYVHFVYKKCLFNKEKHNVLRSNHIGNSCRLLTSIFLHIMFMNSLNSTLPLPSLSAARIIFCKKTDFIFAKSDIYKIYSKFCYRQFFFRDCDSHSLEDRAQLLRRKEAS